MRGIWVAPANATTTYDDGWFGYGKYVAPTPEKKSTLRASTAVVKINGLDDEDSDEPHFSSRSAVPGSGGSADGVGPAATTTASNTPADDPDRPTLHRAGGSGGTSAGSSDSGGSGNTPADDPDRPTLRRRSPAEAKDAQNKSNQSSVTAVANSLNDDPNRPTLHRGKPVGSMNEADIPKLSGLPGDEQLQQMVAVSDAADHQPHDFARAWEDENEHQAILGKMQVAARAQLAAYETANGGVAKAPAPVAGAHTAAGRTVHRAAARPVAPAAAPPEALMDETLKGFTLSYGGAGYVCLPSAYGWVGGGAEVCDAGGSGEHEWRAGDCAEERDRCGAPGSGAADEAGGCGRRGGFESGEPAV